MLKIIAAIILFATSAYAAEPQLGTPESRQAVERIIQDQGFNCARLVSWRAEGEDAHGKRTIVACMGEGTRAYRYTVSLTPTAATVVYDGVIVKTLPEWLK
jgi:hypothetical protein